MLELRHIVKTYQVGDLRQDALKDVSITFRENEFVSILGPSGSGKTTLLNLIGGLDQYTSGDLMIGGVSTRKYRSGDWDFYRNNSVGFVFQSYHLIPHQTVLSNVELALTLAGVSKRERRRRAKEALEKVGLGEHLHKRPSQMSGGQMQRVAIARALVNDPEILLADEPTGALDSETSVQIMDLLSEIAQDRLVIMVTHNPELAKQYSTRIVRLLDGRIVDDSDPCTETEPETEPKKHRKISMSFFTALALSFQNLRTKKGRTLLTAFAGSIGIIGIALILSLSSSVNRYIADIQKETMTSYPISISAEELDLSGFMSMRSMMNPRGGGSQEPAEDREGIYADTRMLEASETMAASVKENNLSGFKRYLDDPDSEIQQYLGDNGAVYGYNVSFEVYSYDEDGVLVNSDAEPESGKSSENADKFSAMRNTMRDNMLAMTSGTGAKNFSELMAGANGETVGRVVTDNYELLYGAWPESYDEIVLVLDENNGIPAESLYQLGMITADQYDELAEQVKEAGEPPEYVWDYEEAAGRSLYLVPACDHYVEDENGGFTCIGGNGPEAEQLLEDALELKISGVIRPRAGADNAGILTAAAYTSKLTDHLIEYTAESAVVKAQEKTPEVNVLGGMKFEAKDDDARVEDAKEYISGLGVSDKASLYQMVLYYSAEKDGEEGEAGEAAPEEEQPVPSEAGQLPPQAAVGGGAMRMDETALAAQLDRWLEETPDREFLLSLYEEYVEGASYEDNMKSFGSVSYDAPDSISIYTDSFEDKEAVSACIENYNKTVGEKDQITYTDYVALLTSSVTSIVDVISYVLIAFVAVSLVVSCIMIGIITHISVLERTREIGILRALGASKRNISQVFNAETFIIGLCAGLLGIGISVLLTFPINSVLQTLLSEELLTVALPLGYGALLVILSVGITMLGGLLPAKTAAGKDPVIALRTE